MPLQFDSTQYKRFESLSHKSTSAASVTFSTDEGVPVVVEAHAPGVFRVRIGAARSPDYKLLARTEPMGDAVVEPVKGGWRIVQGEDALEIHASPLRIKLIRKGETVLQSAADEHFRGAQKAPVFGKGRKGERSIAAFALRSGEPVYGFGECLDALNRRGELIEGRPASRQGAAARSPREQVPFCWSAGGWGVFVHTPAPVNHAVGFAAWSQRAYVIDAEDACLDLFLFVGDPSEILNHYTQLTGRTGMPPLWSLGTWIGTPPSGTPQAAVEAAARLREHGIACDLITLDGATMVEVSTRFGFDWDRARVDDVRRILSALRGNNLKVCVRETPFVQVQSAMFQELQDRGWMLRDRKGRAYVFNQSCGAIDFTHPEAYVFWRDKHKSLFDEGVDALQTDLSVQIPDDVVAHNGDSGVRLRNAYPMLFNRCVHEACTLFKGANDAMICARDGFIGSQRYPVQRSGSTQSGWGAIAASIRGALSSGMTGVASYSVDVDGAQAGAASADLTLRGIAGGVFSPHLRLVDRGVAGALGDEAEKIARMWLAFRYRLIPYLLGAFEDAQRTGLPVMRSMPLAFPKDPVAHGHELQYLLGPALMVAPIVGPDRAIDVYFPRGEAWWDLNTGWRYEGGSRWKFELGPERMPVFGREGHMLCLGPTARHTGEFNSARILDEVWMFGMPLHNPCVMRNKIRVMQMQGSSYAKGLEGLKILPSEGLEIKRRGAEVRISRKR